VTIARWLVALALFALVIGACTRVVVLTGSPDAGNDGATLPDARDAGVGIDDGLDGGPLPDAFTLD